MLSGIDLNILRVIFLALASILVVDGGVGPHGGSSQLSEWIFSQRSECVRMRMGTKGSGRRGLNGLVFNLCTMRASHYMQPMLWRRRIIDTYANGVSSTFATDERALADNLWATQHKKLLIFRIVSLLIYAYACG